MVFVEIVTLVAVLQCFTYGMMVGRARGRFQTPAPAMTGDPVFERYVRVHHNTLEIMVVFLPALWIAAKYWNPAITAGIGLVYVLGRLIYANAYIKNPSTRSLGFMLSASPILILILMAFVGMAINGH